MLFVLLIVGSLAIWSVQGACDDGSKDSNDGDVTAWFKNLGCQIKKGAEDLQESAKPWAEKIAANAKEFGHTVAQKYDEVKHKLTDDDKSTESTARAMHLSGPTEKVPLAPLPSAAALTDGLGEHTPPSESSQTDTADDMKSETNQPVAFDLRFILQPYKCPYGQALDHTHKCREP